MKGPIQLTLPCALQGEFADLALLWFASWSTTGLYLTTNTNIGAIVNIRVNNETSKESLPISVLIGTKKKCKQWKIHMQKTRRSHTRSETVNLTIANNQPVDEVQRCAAVVCAWSHMWIFTYTLQVVTSSNLQVGPLFSCSITSAKKKRVTSTTVMCHYAFSYTMTHDIYQSRSFHVTIRYTSLPARVTYWYTPYYLTMWLHCIYTSNHIAITLLLADRNRPLCRLSVVTPLDKGR